MTTEPIEFSNSGLLHISSRLVLGFFYFWIDLSFERVLAFFWTTRLHLPFENRVPISLLKSLNGFMLFFFTSLHYKYNALNARGAELELVLRITKKSCMASYYRQLPTNNKTKVIRFIQAYLVRAFVPSGITKLVFILLFKYQRKAVNNTIL